MSRVSTTRLRAELAHWLDHVRQPERFVIVTAHGREVAALVPVEDLKLIWNAQDERRVGPIDPSTGRPMGRDWVSRHFEGQYERDRDPESHLHPSREEAPWLGRPFVWPRKGVEEREKNPAPRPKGLRRWWGRLGRR